MILKLTVFLCLLCTVLCRVQPQLRRVKRALILKSARKWENGVVPYEYGVSFNDDERRNMTEAFNAWQRETCIRFRPREASDTNWIRIIDGNKCHSIVGRIPGSGYQNLILAQRCRFFGVIAHELGHALGLLHEHNRPDRDGHIHVNTGTNFNTKEDSDEVLTYGTPYDFQSIMHYGVKEFPSGAQPQISDSTKKDTVGNVYHKDISFFDAKAINLHYGCFSNCRHVECAGHAYQNRSCICESPEEYADRRCFNIRPDGDCNNRADRGHCSLYKVDMRLHCRKACNTCFKHGSHGVHVRKKVCRDFNDDCAGWSSTGECESNHEYMKVQCPKSCRYCVPTPGSEPTTQPPPCVDKSPSSRCRVWKGLGNCRNNRYKVWMSRNCYATCTECGGPITTTPRPCRDISDSSECNQWRNAGNCQNPEYSAWMTVNCYKACSGCSGTGSPSSDETTTTSSTTVTTTTTTTTTVKPTTTTPNANPSCVDANSECPGWASRGECGRNRDWMSTNCARSCNTCATDPSCVDSNTNCPSWASRGECTANRGWMSTNCARSCNTCNRVCADHSPSCKSRAARGQCESNQTFMRASCRMSCNLCACENTGSNCPIRASDCRRKSQFKNCRSSCSFCGVCKDQRSDCAEYFRAGYCRYIGIMRACMFTCNMCR